MGYADNFKNSRISMVLCEIKKRIEFNWIHNKMIETQGAKIWKHFL